jgi:Ca2+-binding RTX toxin-like protein
MLAGVNVVGAVNVADTPAEGGTPTPEGFSSAGGSDFLLAPNGTALASPVPANGPDFLAPDGAGTSVFNPFIGTSAAAPVAAATAALMLQADPALGNADVTTLLEDSALPVASSDDAAGAGLIQANLATRYAGTRVISGSPQSVVRGLAAACTIEGGAGAHWLLAGSGATLIESQGTDSVQAGAGADTVDLTGAQAALYGGAGATLVRTLGGNDTIVGGGGALTVLGGAGGGVIFGSTAGHNELIAGAQQTTIVSRGGNDFLVGGGNGDLLYASNFGQETLVGGGGTDILVGGASGVDVFVAGAGSPLIAPEASTAVVTFGAGNATVLGGTAAELLQAIDGQGGGFDVVDGFDPLREMLLLTGFGVGPAEAAIADQYDNGGDTWLKLPDGTVIAFVGLSHLAAGNVSYG